MAPSYKLSYFDLPDRAEPIRILFAYGGIKYEDERFSFEEWPKYKPNTPFGQVPVLFVDGEPIAQSISITRYAGRIVKLAGSNELEALKIDSVADFTTEFVEHVAKSVFEPNEETKKEAYKVLMDKHVPFYLKKLDTIAEANGGHLAVNKLTWADIYFVNCVEWITNGMKIDVFADYPNLLAVKKNVLAVPEIKNYIKTRSPTSSNSYYDLKQDL